MIEIRTRKEGDPRELWVNGIFAGTLTLEELGAFAADLVGRLPSHYKRPVKVFAGHGVITLTWAEAHDLAERAVSAMRWG